MANRIPRGKRPAGKTRAKTKAAAKKVRAKKPYGRNHHRHEPDDEDGSGKSKLKRETTGVDEDLDYGAATRGHRWSRDPAVYVGGMPDRRQSFGRRASDKTPPETFTLQSEVRSDQRRR